MHTSKSGSISTPDLETQDPGWTKTLDPEDSLWIQGLQEHNIYGHIYCTVTYTTYNTYPCCYRLLSTHYRYYTRPQERIEEGGRLPLISCFML